MFIITQVRNEENRIIEWINYHSKIIGIEKFIIFDDNSNDKTKDFILNIKNEFVIELFDTEKIGEYSESKNPDIYGTSDLHKRILNSMNNGLKFLKNDEKNLKKWVFFIEVDEFIKQEMNIINYIETIPKNINRLWIPSYDFCDNFVINNNILNQSKYRWSEKTRNNNFIGRCKSALKIVEYEQNIECIHNLDSSPCVRTSGSIFNDDKSMIRQDRIGIKLFHYRKPSLFSVFDEYDDSLCNLKFN